ncbi:purine-binding chemotaxis protein CheW [Streptohalobacillus salinus]|uniref:Purine-binding chemotaxis protein CheW n=1 Tax=Streptohalobacillus salinus TaxID=621096 RepID=A0A2V3WRU8_9BACI|nr:chemotaxis protein CheW [Streptohalobacillus salinus]PXW91429.1 purine-binding chemotaxis protein CheW [Streptohalobacillus salinus]
MSTEKFIVFQLKGQEYGASIQQIVSIEKLQDIVSLPQVSDFIEGITKLRGEVIPVIDLKARMDMEKSEKTDQSRMLVALVDGVSVGFIVDAASDVLDIDEEIIEPAPTTIRGVHAHFLNGVAKLEDRLLLLVDLAYILNHDEIKEVKQVVEEE